MTDPLVVPLQVRHIKCNLQNVESALLQMKMDSGTPCVKCDKTFYSAKDLTNHLTMHAAMERRDDIAKTFQSLKNLKMQVNLVNLNLPIERSKRKREGSDEVDSKRIKIQDGSKEISVNCQIDKLICKICKRNFKDAQPYKYHMVVNHGELDSSYLPTTPSKSLLDSPNETFTPNKSKIRVKSQLGTVEMVDIVEDSPNKLLVDEYQSSKLNSLIVNNASGSIDVDNVDQGEGEVNNSNVGKFPASLEEVRKLNKVRSKRSTNEVVPAAASSKESKPQQKNCINLKFKEYLAADSESDFEIHEKEAVPKINVKKLSPVNDGEEVYKKVAAVIDKVLLRDNSKLSTNNATSKRRSQVGPHRKLDEESSNGPKALVKLVAKYSNSLDDSVTSSLKVEMSEVTKLDRSVDSLKSKSESRIEKSNGLISDNVCVDSSGVISISDKGKSEIEECEKLSNKSTTACKVKLKSDSDSYNPETQSSDSATANSEIEFALPLRKSSRVRGPKPPQIRDPIENPAPKSKKRSSDPLEPKAKRPSDPAPKPKRTSDPVPKPAKKLSDAVPNPNRRLSERKFEGAKPFKCNHCPLDFSNIESKKLHEQTHEEKPYQCVYCDMRFTIELSLKKHSRIHKN